MFSPFYSTDLSPNVNTPFFDSSSSIDTPFNDNYFDSSPFSIDSIPFYFMQDQSLLLNDYNSDICVSAYLSNSLINLPIKEFNGDPKVLMLNQPSDTLFPPLHEDESINFDQLLDKVIDSDIESMKEEPEENIVTVNNEPKENIMTMNNEPKENIMPVNNEPKENLQIKIKVKKTIKKKKSKSKKNLRCFQCPFCEHVSKRKFNLSTHIKTHDKNRIRRFSCDLCPKSFDRKHDRDRHLATVHNKDGKICTHCDVKYNRKDALRRHLIHKHNYTESDFTS